MTLPADGRSGPIPTLVGSSKLLPSTRLLWRELWKSPIAAAWIDVDVFPLTRLMEMVDRRSRGNEAPSLAGEIRQLEDRFGLSPVARQRLRWQIAAARDPEPVRHLRSAVGDGRDPRELLRDESAGERFARMFPGGVDAPGVNHNGRARK